MILLIRIVALGVDMDRSTHLSHVREEFCICYKAQDAVKKMWFAKGDLSRAYLAVL